MRLRNHLRCNSGIASTEFAFVAALIAIAGIAAFASLGEEVLGMFETIDNKWEQESNAFPVR